LKKNSLFSTQKRLFLFLDHTRKNVVDLTQKTLLKNAITDGLTMLEKSSVGDPNLSKTEQSPSKLAAWIGNTGLKALRFRLSSKKSQLL
jgi:hypothetical protein